MEHNQSRSLFIFSFRPTSRLILPVLLRTFLAGNAVARPGQRLQPFRADFFLAHHALTERTVGDSRQRRVDSTEQSTRVGGLLEHQFLIQGAVCAVPFVGAIRVLHGAAFFGRLRYAAQQFLASLQKLLLESFNTFLFHSDFPEALCVNLYRT